MFNCCNNSTDSRALERLVCEAKKAAERACEAARVAECAAEKAQEAAVCAEAAAAKAACMLEEYLQRNAGCGCHVNHDCYCN